MSIFKRLRTRERVTDSTQVSHIFTREERCLCQGPKSIVKPSNSPEANVLRITQTVRNSRGYPISTSQINLCKDKDGHYCHLPSSDKRRGIVCPQPDTLPASNFELEVVQMRTLRLQEMVRQAEKQRNSQV